MNLHLATIASDSFNAYADKTSGRVFVSMAGYQALLSLTPDEARTLATGLLNAAVELAVPVQVAA